MHKNKRILIFVALMCAAVVGLGLVGCNDIAQVTNVFQTYDGQSVSVTGDAGSAIDFPQVSRDGYAFDGWYTTPDFSGEPVTEAKHEEGVTYYAKWSPVYEVEFDLDGGSFAAATLPLKLREGEVVYNYVADYVPTKGDLQFGGWFVGDDELSETYVMTKYGVTLVAKYKAAYTVNAYLQNDDLETYTEHSAYLTGYEYVDEELMPEIDGYILVDADDALIINQDSTKNVFDLHFDRKPVNVVFSANYPNNEQGITVETYFYGAEITLPADLYSYNGYRFLGWSKSADSVEIVGDDKYSVTQNVVLYAVWNHGYVDMFGGSDYIYVSPFGDGKATLCRGGIDIDGTYDERRDVYTFAGENGFELRAKVIKDSGTFVYYSDRQGSAYYLYTNGAIDEHYELSLDRTNVVQYYSTAQNDRFEKTGTYSINDMGIYVAEFEDGTSFEFLTGTAMDGSNRAIFRIRGDEYEYDAMGLYGRYFPVIVLDGFGNVLYISNSTAKEAYYTYTISKSEEKTVITIVMPSGGLTVRVFDYDGVYGFEPYSAALDHAFTDGTRTLTPDGCSNATYNDGNATVTGTYTVTQSIFGGYIVTLTSADKEYVFHAYSGGEENSVSYDLAVLSENYTEYRYLTPTGSLGNEPYLVVNGADTAALYEQHDDELQQVSSGSFVKQDDSYLYTVSGDIAEWSNNKYTSLVVNLNAQSSSYSVYYRLSATDAEGTTTDYTTVYNNPADNTTLTLVASFAFYSNGTVTVSGSYSDNTTYMVMSSGNTYYYFALDKANLTFERLARVPIVLTYRNTSGVTSTGTTLTVTGRTVAEDVFEAIYAVTSGGNTVITHGKYTAATVEGLGIGTFVYTFTSDDETLTFKFLSVGMNNRNYFIYYAADQTVDLATFTEASEEGEDVDGSTIVLTDKVSGNGANIVEYTYDGNVIEGTCTSKELMVFDDYVFDVYTFTSTDGKTVFEFTLVNSYFRRSVATEQFTSADGGTLTVDGRVHIARYKDGDGNVTDGGYLIVDNVLNETDRAVLMVFGDEEMCFDLNTTAETFAVRGEEAATYVVFENTFTTGQTIALDGHGHATLIAGGVTVGSGTYTQDDGLFTVVVGSDTYNGRLDVVMVGNAQYNGFILSQLGIAGSYINKADLSVLVLDDVGGVVKYSSRGVADSGTYVRIDDNTFYYVNSSSTDAAMYTFTSNGQVVGANYNATYYADDFRSIVFYLSGALVINNDEVLYYTYDAATDKIYTYTPSNSNNANKYGFLRGEFTISGKTVTYNNVVYSYYDGKYIEFTDEAGNKLEFMPTGDAEFFVEATYTAVGATKGDNSYAVGVSYDDEGNVSVFLSNVEEMSFAGSYDKYKVMSGAALDISFNNKTFSLDESNMEYEILAYDYQYMVVLATYDMNSVIGQLYAQLYFGELNIHGKRTENGNIEYTLSGQINAIAPAGRRSVSFENGKLSQAGYRNNNYGNMFTAEFVGDDDNTYHMNFFLIQSGIDGMCIYLVYSCTRVDAENTITLDDGSVVYAEEFVYTSGFDIQNDDGTSIKVGDTYFPTLKYKGEIICAVDYEELDENTWRFMSRVFVGDMYADYYYYYTFTVGDDESITPIEVVRRVAYNISAGDDNTVRVITSSTTEVDDIYDILYMIYNGEAVIFDSCVNNGDGSFTATTADGIVYTISFTSTTEGETTKITATVTQVTD